MSYIYSLAVFEDYLYATHSDPSKGSPSVELLQIHRFNITAESRTLASLGNARGLRVYHKLSQPRGKGCFLCRLTCAGAFGVKDSHGSQDAVSLAYNDYLFPFAVLIFSTVRSHACEKDSYGKMGGCSHICLLSGSYKSRTCRCRTGYNLGSDGQSCKSQYFVFYSLNRWPFQ